MAKNRKKKTPNKKSRRARAEEPLKIRIPIRESKATTPDVELAITAKLATQPTDLFKQNDKVIIVLEREDRKSRS